MGNLICREVYSLKNIPMYARRIVVHFIRRKNKLNFFKHYGMAYVVSDFKIRPILRQKVNRQS